MQILLLALSDRGFGLGVDTEGDLHIFRPAENSQLAIGSVVQAQAETSLLFGVETLPKGVVPSYPDAWRYSLLAAIAALLKLEQPQRILTRHKLFTADTPDLVNELAAALFTCHFETMSNPQSTLSLESFGSKRGIQHRSSTRRTITKKKPKS
jgi:hypothetical protein